jgi:hypothetical protein
MRYINALIDYPRYKTTSQRVQKLFMVNPYRVLLRQMNQKVYTVVPNLTSVYRH